MSAGFAPGLADTSSGDGASRPAPASARTKGRHRSSIAHAGEGLFFRVPKDAGGGRTRPTGHDGRGVHGQALNLKKVGCETRVQYPTGGEIQRLHLPTLTGTAFIQPGVDLNTYLIDIDPYRFDLPPIGAQISYEILFTVTTPPVPEPSTWVGFDGNEPWPTCPCSAAAAPRHEVISPLFTRIDPTPRCPFSGRPS